MTHVPRPGNPPPPRPLASRPPGGAHSRAPNRPLAPPHLGRSSFGGLFAACAAGLATACAAPGPAGSPPAPQTFFSNYRSGADGDAPADAPADAYADLFAFRDGEGAPPPGAEPWPPGTSLRGAALNPHRRLEKRGPPPPVRSAAP